MKNILENNIIIAKFMGATLTKDLQIMYPVYEGDSSYVKDLKYHSDWNWLMKVIEKILNVSLELDSMEMYYNITDSIPDIVKTYEKSVEFIKWYNEQNKNNESL